MRGMTNTSPARTATVAMISTGEPCRPVDPECRDPEDDSDLTQAERPEESTCAAARASEAIARGEQGDRPEDEQHHAGPADKVRDE